MASRPPSAPADVVEKLAKASPKAAQMKGGLFEQMPLHLAAERGASDQATEALWRACPLAAEVKGRRGKPLLLEWAKKCGHDRVVSFLADDASGSVGAAEEEWLSRPPRARAWRQGQSPLRAGTAALPGMAGSQGEGRSKNEA